MNAKENENVRACTMDAQTANTKAVKIPLFECGDSVSDIDYRMRWKVVNIMNFNKKGEIKYQCVDDLNGSIRAYIPESKLYPLSPVSDRNDMKLLLDLLQPLIESAKEKHNEYVKYCGSSEPMDSGPCDYLNQLKRIHKRLYLCYTRDYPGRSKPRYNENTELSELMEGVIDRPAGFSYKSGMQEVSELLESNNVKIENCDPDFVKPSKIWSPCKKDPLWNFQNVDYRAVPKCKDTVNEVSPKLDQGANEVELTKAQRDLDRIAKANLHVKEALELYESLEKDNPITVMTQEQLMMAFTCINNADGLAKKMIKQEKELGNESGIIGNKFSNRHQGNS